MQQLVTSLWRGICALPNLLQDLIVYLLAALFAGVNGVVAYTADYREWGILALVPYIVAAAATVFAFELHRRRTLTTTTIRRVRVATVAFLGLTVVLVPLLAELVWRATATQNSHAQPEVAVIERAGDRIAAGNNPYPVHPTTYGVPPSNDVRTVDATAFFPYLPGMAAFGLLNATSIPPELGDARVLLSLVALLSFFTALYLTRSPPERKIRATQFFLALPVGALPMVTGGDDLPVLGLILLSLVLLHRRYGVAAGVAAAIACSLKLTAWPIAILAILAVSGRADRRVRRGYLGGLAIIVPVLLIGMAGNTHAFIENVVRFPLGLTHVKSPAASPLLGQFLVSLMPSHRRVITLVLGIVGVAIVGLTFVRYRPRDVAAVARFAAFALCVATVLAPATRFGYLIYPTILFIWSYVITGSEQPNLDDRRAALG